MPQHTIFLSHNSQDKPGAEKLKNDIEAHELAQKHQVTVWLDKERLDNDGPFPPQLSEAVQDESKSHSFLLYLTNNPITPWMEKEISLAVKRNADTKKQGKRYPLIPAYAHAMQGSVQLPAMLDDMTAREQVATNPNEIRAIIQLALGAYPDDPERPAPSDTTPLTSQNPSAAESGHGDWISFHLYEESGRFYAEDDEGKRILINQSCISDAPIQHKRNLAQALLDNKPVPERIRIMTDMEQCAVWPWHELPHPNTGNPLIQQGCVVEVGPVTRAYRAGFDQVALHNPLMVVPQKTKGFLCDDHYTQVTANLEAYFNIQSPIDRASSKGVLQHQLQWQGEHDLIYLYARYQNGQIQLDDSDLSLDDLGAHIAKLPSRPFVILSLISDQTIKTYPQKLVKASRLLWIQYVRRDQHLDHLKQNLFNVLSNIDQQPDIVHSILRRDIDKHTIKNLLWINGLSPSVQTVKDIQRRLRAALLKVLLGRKDLKDRIAGSLYGGKQFVYGVTGDRQSCPHDVPHQVRQRLRWEDPEKGRPVPIFYFTIDIAASADVAEAIEDATYDGMPMGDGNMQNTLENILNENGLLNQACYISLNWLFTFEPGQENNLQCYLEHWITQYDRYFSQVDLNGAIILNAICLQIKDEQKAQSIQNETNEILSRLSRSHQSYLKVIDDLPALTNLRRREIIQFLDEDESHWHKELRLDKHNVDPEKFTEWVFKKKQGRFEDTVNLIWRSYKNNHQDYLNHA